MFLKCNRRFKDGKDHRYWSIVENKRTKAGRVVQRQVLYLAKLTTIRNRLGSKVLRSLNQDTRRRGKCLFSLPIVQSPQAAVETIQVELNKIELRNARQWGACWLFSVLWDQLGLDHFWAEKLLPSRKGTRWLNVFKTLTACRLLDPGSEWWLHCFWYQRSAMGDLLGEDFGLVQKDKLYRCLDKLVEHKEDLFSFLKKRWQDMFNASFDILLYDLTSTYFECNPPEQGKRKYGYSRDKRSDCVQVVIALIVTPQGLPLAYEVMPGNTRDSNTLESFLEKIEKLYGKAERMWVMDRGIPTEESIEKMKNRETPVKYLIGTPKGRLSKLEKSFLELPWEQVRGNVQVRLLEKDQELYILVKSKNPMNKERSMRSR